LDVDILSAESFRLTFYLTPFIPSSLSGEGGTEGGEVFTGKNYAKEELVAATFRLR